MLFVWSWRWTVFSSVLRHCRFSTKSWLSQTCQVCHKSMMFGVKCKHCKYETANMTSPRTVTIIVLRVLWSHRHHHHHPCVHRFKCHNKCTKDAPSCRISFLTCKQRSTSFLYRSLFLFTSTYVQIISGRKWLHKGSRKFSPSVYLTINITTK